MRDQHEKLMTYQELLHKIARGGGGLEIPFRNSVSAFIVESINDKLRIVTKTEDALIINEGNYNKALDQYRKFIGEMMRIAPADKEVRIAAPAIDLHLLAIWEEFGIQESV